MSKEAMYTIWSLRTSTAKGNHWHNERDSLESNVQGWLKVLRDDEPNVIFVAKKGNRAPKAPK